MKVTVPAGTYPHGTNAKYVLEKCRCQECRIAVARHRKLQELNKRLGRGGNVDAEPARQHVKALMRTGMGYKRIAQAAGLNPKTVYVLVAGRSERQTPPPKQIRRETSEKLMAVVPVYRARQCVDAADLWRMIADLMGLGYSKAWIARELGLQSLQFGKRYTHVKSLLAVWKLWKRTVTPRPAETHHDKVAASRARNQAARVRNTGTKGSKPKSHSGQGTRRPDRQIAHKETAA